MTRIAHHRIGPHSRPSGRAAELAEAIREAGRGGISQCALAEVVGCRPCNLDAMLATVTPRYPRVYEDDAGRLYWGEWDEDGE